MNMNYAETIKQLRIKKNMTQKDLAQGICSQGLISKIEKQEINSDIIILSKIAEKLDVSVGYLIGETNQNGEDWALTIEKNIKNIEELINQHKFLELETFFTRISATIPFFKNNVAFKLWIESIIEAQNRNQLEKAIEKCQQGLQSLDDAQNLENHYFDLEFHLNNAIGNYYALIENHSQAIEYYLKALRLVELNADKYSNQIKSLYGLSRSYSAQNNVIESNFYAERAIQISTQNNTLDHTDSLYLLLARNYISSNEFDKAEKCLKKAEIISEILMNHYLTPYINRNAAVLKEKLMAK